MKRLLLLLCLAFTLIANAEKVIVFDFGGVMIHPDKEKKAFYDFIQSTFHFDETTLQSFRTSTLPNIAFWLQLAEKYQIALPSEWKEQYNNAALEYLNVSQQMRNLVKFYKEMGIQVALLSNVSAESAALYRSNGLYDDFYPVLLSCEIGVSKPDPRAFQILLSKINTRPEECIFIDDKKENIDAAKALRIDAIQFFRVEQVVEDLEARFK
jgi:putative hydrolase of the HAD superfamily